MTPLFHLLIIFFIINVGNCQMCDNSYSCQLETLSNISNCRGYFACYESPSITYTSNFRCSGSYSCYRVNTIASPDIQCSGLCSCAFVQKMDEMTRGYGAYSSYAVANGTGGWFYGHLSCYNCTIIVQSGKNIIYADGALAFVNSHISSTTTTSTLDGRSYLTFYNSEYHCLSGHQCDMKCYGGNACENAIFTCDALATCTVDCQYSTKNELCPYGLDADWLSELSYDNLLITEDSLKNYNWIFTTYENSYEACYSPITNAINCDAYLDQTCYGQSVTNSNGPMCCTGLLSCYYGNILVSDPNINSTNDVAIRCDSRNACNNANIKTQNGGNIYCSGYYSCSGATMNATKNTNIFCEGSASCASGINIYDAKNLLCLGHMSCNSANIYNLAGNVYGLASYSLQYSQMYNINGNIYCLAYLGAESALIDVAYNVYGNSFKCYYHSQISNVNNLYLIGQSILENSVVTNVQNIYVSGTNSLSNSKIENFREIEIHGNSSLSNTTLISGNYSETEVNILIYDNYDAILPSNIHCSLGDTCNIFCLSSAACDLLHLFCYGHPCHVDCDESNGIACPLSGVWNEFVSKVPTSNPTKYQTNNSSKYSSVAPTINPTLFHTTYNSDTIHPTIVPVSKSDDVENIFNFTQATFTQIIIGTCIIIACCCCPLLIGIGIWFIFSYNKPRESSVVNIKVSNSNILNVKNEVLKQPGLPKQDSLKIKPNCTEKIELINLPSQHTLNIEGLVKNKLTTPDSMDKKILNNALAEVLDDEKKINLNRIDSEKSDGMYAQMPQTNDNKIENDEKMSFESIDRMLSDDMYHKFETKNGDIIKSKKILIKDNIQKLKDNAITTKDIGDV